MFRRYFSDFYKWNIVVAILFGIAYILGIAWGDFRGNRWLIPACYLVVLLSAVNYFVLFFVALRDLKQDRIEEAAILIQEIVRDKKHNYFNRSGAMTGSEKCLLIDSKGSKYRVVLQHDLIIAMRPPEYYTGAQVVVRYLSKSRIVLNMKLERPEASDDATYHLHKDFHDYFQSKMLS